MSSRHQTSKISHFTSTLLFHQRTTHFLSSSSTMKSSTISFIGILASTKWQSSSGFAIPSTGVQRSSSLHALNNDNTSCDRLTFLTTIATAAMASPLVAYADGGFEDLSMPSADEQKAQNVSTLTTRIMMADDNPYISTIPKIT